jgi:hypothetical protein
MTRLLGDDWSSDWSSKEAPMNQPAVSAIEPIILAAVDVALVEDAARELEGVSEEIPTPGHSPSWSFPQVPDGLALCVGCWRLITARQLGGERCPGTERRTPPKEWRPAAVGLSASPSRQP